MELIDTVVISILTKKNNATFKNNFLLYRRHGFIICYLHKVIFSISSGNCELPDANHYVLSFIDPKLTERLVTRLVS